MLQKADSVGVFQVESRAQMSMLPRLKPANYYDLVIEVAIVRPGPIQGNMVHPYLRRRKGEEAVTYSNDAVRQVLERTLGIPIFQEQVIELAMVAAGFSAGEADSLRRAMAAWKRHGGLEPFERKLINGMLERGHDREFAERVFEQIKGFRRIRLPGIPFREFRAPGLHLRVAEVPRARGLLLRHPEQPADGLLQPLAVGQGRHRPRHRRTRRRRPGERPGTTGWRRRLHPYPAIVARNRRSGSVCVRVKGLHEEAGRRVEEAQPFRDIDDLTARAALDDRALTCLARAGALKTLSGHRYQAHWDAAGVDRPLQIQRETAPYHTEVALDGPGDAKEMLADYRYLGLSLGPHHPGPPAQ